MHRREFAIKTTAGLATLPFLLRPNRVDADASRTDVLPKIRTEHADHVIVLDFHDTHVPPEMLPSRMDDAFLEYSLPADNEASAGGYYVTFDSFMTTKLSKYIDPSEPDLLSPETREHLLEHADSINCADIYWPLLTAQQVAKISQVLIAVIAGFGALVDTQTEPKRSAAGKLTRRSFLTVSSLFLSGALANELLVTKDPSYASARERLLSLLNVMTDPEAHRFFMRDVAMSTKIGYYEALRETELGRRPLFFEKVGKDHGNFATLLQLPLPLRQALYRAGLGALSTTAPEKFAFMVEKNRGIELLAGIRQAPKSSGPREFTTLMIPKLVAALDFIPPVEIVPAYQPNLPPTPAS